MKGKVFTAQEVQSIISGNKTMFREVIKNANYDSPVHSYKDWENNGLYYPVATLVDENGTQFTETQYSFDGIRCPYQVGQKIFVKESFSTDEIFGESCVNDISYEANWEKDNAKGFFGFFDEPKWEPASQMKQEHSRLTLQIKEITVERLQHINEEDCKKEGIGYTGGWNGEDYDDGEFFFGKLVETEDGMNWKNEMFEYADLAFEKYWNSTHKKPKEKFEASPWVWSIQFEVEND
jgi:hypothetical protein